MCSGSEVGSYLRLIYFCIATPETVDRGAGGVERVKGVAKRAKDGKQMKSSDQSAGFPLLLKLTEVTLLL